MQCKAADTLAAILNAARAAAAQVAAQPPRQAPLVEVALPQQVDILPPETEEEMGTPRAFRQDHASRLRRTKNQGAEEDGE